MTCASTLREKAERYRRLARSISDQSLSEAAESLADEMDRQAADKDRQAAGSDPEARERSRATEPKSPTSNRRTIDLREIVNAIRFKSRVAWGWEMPPIAFGPPDFIHWWFYCCKQQCRSRCWPSFAPHRVLRTTPQYWVAIPGDRTN